MRRYLFVGLGVGAAVLVALLSGQSLQLQPRPGQAVTQSADSGSSPVGSPLPSNPQCATCTPPNFGGQSSTVPGAVNLTGCGRYAVTTCAGTGCALLSVGTDQAFYWPLGLAGTSSTVWPRNQALDEQFSTQPSGVQCYHFPGHAADGIGWIAIVPSNVTQDGGCTTVTTLIEGSLCGS